MQIQPAKQVLAMLTISIEQHGRVCSMHANVHKQDTTCCGIAGILFFLALPCHSHSSSLKGRCHMRKLILRPLLYLVQWETTIVCEMPLRDLMSIVLQDTNAAW